VQSGGSRSPHAESLSAADPQKAAESRCIQRRLRRRCLASRSARSSARRCSPGLERMCQQGRSSIARDVAADPGEEHRQEAPERREWHPQDCGDGRHRKPNCAASEEGDCYQACSRRLTGELRTADRSRGTFTANIHLAGERNRERATGDRPE
jgi:hypothetical protein